MGQNRAEHLYYSEIWAIFKLNVCSRLKTDSADDKVVCS